jgi:hypothetical protein
MIHHAIAATAPATVNVKVRPIPIHAFRTAWLHVIPIALASRSDSAAALEMITPTARNTVSLANASCTLSRPLSVFVTNPNPEADNPVSRVGKANTVAQET